MRCEGNHAPLKGVAANPWLWLLRGDDNGLKMNRFHEELGANPRRSWLNSRNGKIRHLGDQVEQGVQHGFDPHELWGERHGSLGFVWAALRPPRAPLFTRGFWFLGCRF